MQHVLVCLCRTELNCEPEDFYKVYQCDSCKTIWGCVQARSGRRGWIKISESDAEFHQLLKEPTEDD